MIDFLLAVPGKLTTIYSHLTTYLGSTRMAKVDNLDAAISTRAGATTAVSNADYTPAKAVFIDAAITGRLGSIKAIYRGTIAVASAASSATATITAVDTAKSILISLGSYSTSSTTDPGVSRLELTNSTTITAYKNSANANMAVGYQVIELN